MGYNDEPSLNKTNGISLHALRAKPPKTTTRLVASPSLLFQLPRSPPQTWLHGSKMSPQAVTKGKLKIYRNPQHIVAAAILNLTRL